MAQYGVLWLAFVSTVVNLGIPKCWGGLQFLSWWNPWGEEQLQFCSSRTVCHFVAVRLIPSSCSYLKWLAGWLSRSSSGRKPTSGRCGIGYSFLRRNHLYVELQQEVPDQRLLYTGVANGKCLCVSLLIRWGATLTSPHLGVSTLHGKLLCYSYRLGESHFV